MKTTQQAAPQATQKATKQLQMVYDFLGHRNGIITTDRPNTWWNLILEREKLTDEISEFRIGVYRDLEGELIFDPAFYLYAEMDGDRIIHVDIGRYVSELGFATIVIDEQDRVISSHGEKDVYGLRRRFSSFMDNMTEAGPYLTTGKIREEAE